MADYVGKASLERIREEGVNRKLVGIEAPGDPSFFEITHARPALVGGQPVGRVTDLPGSVPAAVAVGQAGRASLAAS